MAKLDKETMKKQHFWLLLIPLFIGLILAWVGLFFGVSDATAEQAKKNQEEKDKVEKTKAQPKKTLDLYEVRKQELYGLRTLRWEEMWALQQAVYEWPKVLGEDQIVKVRPMKFGDEITDTSFLDLFKDQSNNAYRDEV